MKLLSSKGQLFLNSIFFKKHKFFDFRIFKLWVHIKHKGIPGEEQIVVTQDVSTTHATVKDLAGLPSFGILPVCYTASHPRKPQLALSLL
jgi:hypothetical protein